MKRSCIAIVLGSSMLFAGCGGKASEPPPAAPEVPAARCSGARSCGSPYRGGSCAGSPYRGGRAALAPRTLEVKLEPKSKSKLVGSATLTETDGGVRVVLTVEGISPGDHGAHVHEKGDCSAPDGASAGGHFNPAGHQHGLPAVEQRHLGDPRQHHRRQGRQGHSGHHRPGRQPEAGRSELLCRKGHHRSREEGRRRAAHG